MLSAAAALFQERGYAETTVRAIAERAGLSPAGLFTTFTDKADILHHVRMAQTAELRAGLEREARALDGPAVDRFCSLVRVAYRAEWPNLPLVIAHIGASYGWSEETERSMQEDLCGVSDAYRAVLAHGVAEGELRADLDLDLAVELIHGITNGNYRLAWARGWTADQAADHVDRKLRLMFEGVAA